MEDKEFEKLKRKVAEETQRRYEIEQQKQKVEFYKKGLGLQQPNGWCMNMKIKIIQDVDMLQGVDGSGRPEHRHYETELDELECKMLFESFEQMVKIYDKTIKGAKRKCQK